MFQTTIDAAMLHAYRETEYRVAGDRPFILRIGQHSPELDSLHARYRCSASAYVTAYNPFSRSLSRVKNRLRHAQLGGLLTSRGLVHLRGTGQHPTNGWPGERSYLILGLDLDAARELGTRYEQNAIVWAGSDAVPQLIQLR